MSSAWRLGPDLEWQEQAECRQPMPSENALASLGRVADRFFSEGPAPLDVRRQCAVCPVREMCLQWALDNGERGYWGGMSQAQRDQLRKEVAA